MTVLFMQAYASVRGLSGKVLGRTHSERGASMVEYALLVGLIAIAAIAAVTFLGGQISNLFNNAGNNLNGVG